MSSTLQEPKVRDDDAGILKAKYEAIKDDKEATHEHWLDLLNQLASKDSLRKSALAEPKLFYNLLVNLVDSLPEGYYLTLNLSHVLMRKGKFIIEFDLRKRTSLKIDRQVDSVPEAWTDLLLSALANSQRIEVKRVNDFGSSKRKGVQLEG